MSLRLALSRGAGWVPSRELLAAVGLPVETLRGAHGQPSCTLDDGTTVMTVRPRDVPLYVESGVVDLGFVGKDVLLEQGRDVCELLDLRLAPGRLMFAAARGAEARARRLGRMRVATSYPRAARRHFERTGRQAEIVPVHEAAEMGAATGLADGVVSLVRSGAALRAGGLVEREEIARCSLRLVANRAARVLHGDEIGALVERLRAAVEAP
jgi:ATP phosphoribosyltransferase